MNINEHTTPAKLERYAFVWLLLLLAFSTVAMFMGARPVITLVMGYSVWSLLNLTWLICGVAAAYLTYQYTKSGKTVFGGTEKKDVLAFYFMLAAGFNLGLTGILGNNIYLNLVYGQLAYIVTGVVCLLVAYQLYTSWKKNGERVFSFNNVVPVVKVNETETTVNNHSPQSDSHEHTSENINN